MRNHNAMIKFGKQSIRDIGGGFGGYMTQGQKSLKISTCDSVDAKLG